MEWKPPADSELDQISFDQPETSTVQPSHDERDRLLAEVVKRRDSLKEVSRGEIVLLGFPSDRGVKLNGGRSGAAAGPAAIRRQLLKMIANTAGHGGALDELNLADLGDLALKGDPLEDDQDSLGKTVAALLNQDCFPILLGGGHETAFGHLQGYFRAGKQVAVINIDAHHDCRKASHSTSGTSFRQAQEQGEELFARYVLLGAQNDAVSESYMDYLFSRNALAVFRDEIYHRGARSVIKRVLELLPEDAAIMLSLDLGAIDSAFAPGVSTPCVNGLQPAEVFQMIEVIATDPRLASFEVAELNPQFDVDNRTARLGAVAIRSLLAVKAGKQE